MKEKHILEHITLILDFLEGEELDSFSKLRANYLLNNCNECKSLQLFHENTEKVLSSDKVRDRILDRMKKESPKIYKEYIQALGSSDKGIEIIWNREDINENKLLELGLAAAGPIKLDYKTKKAILTQLGILSADKSSKNAK